MRQHPHDCCLDNLYLQNFTTIWNNSWNNFYRNRPVAVHHTLNNGWILWICQKQRDYNGRVRSWAVTFEWMAKWAKCEHTKSLLNIKRLDNRKHNVRCNSRVSTQKYCQNEYFATQKVRINWIECIVFSVRKFIKFILLLIFSVGMFGQKRILLEFERTRPKQLKKKLKNRDESLLPWVQFVFFCYKHFALMEMNSIDLIKNWLF